MASTPVSLRIYLPEIEMSKTLQFDPASLVVDICRIVKEKVGDPSFGNSDDYGLFLNDEDPTKGMWLESSKSLDYYMLKSGSELTYKKKLRPLRVRMMDESVKTVMIDDSQNVGEILLTICDKIGISNSEEFSLLYEPNDDDRNMGTLRKGMSTLEKKDKLQMRDQKKMEMLKKKLHTDDELNWLDLSKTMREQGVDESGTVMFRRKYFYSDQNVDSRDPVQLNLLYVQARDGILDGTHPITLDEAVQLGAYQCQVQYGSFVETKHKPGFLELKDVLPKDYAKNKVNEKKIFTEHRKLLGMSDVEAKVKYVSMCRSLKTYGVTFFLVKEKMKGKNKLVPRLLGITKESVMRVDEKTKEVLKVWPLTTVRRWAASPKSFTLDFGDYSESFYSVQTTEGEQISALIAGYIDIILKKKKGRDRVGLEGDEDAMLLEDCVSPHRATIVQHHSTKTGQPQAGNVAMPGVMRSGGDGASSYQTGSMQQIKYGTTKGQAVTSHKPQAPGPQMRVHQPSHAQKALLGNISAGFSAIGQAQTDLTDKAHLPPLGSDPASLKWKQNTLDMNKQNLVSQLSAMSAATATVVSETAADPNKCDPTAVGSAVTTISSNLTELAKGVRMIAALLDDDPAGDKLLDATRKLTNAFGDLLKSAQPGSNEPRQNLLTAASNIGQASNDMLYTIGEMDTDPQFQDTLMSLAKAVANSTAHLVMKAKDVAGVVDDQHIQNRLIGAATQCALSTSQMVACTKVIAPTISNPACQEELVKSCKMVAKNVEDIMDAGRDGCKDDDVLNGLGHAATAVTQALTDLLEHIKTASQPAKEQGQFDDTCDAILCATDKLFSSTGNAPEMVKHARELAQATTQLVSAIRMDAEEEADPDVKKRLFNAAKLLTDATQNMLEAAKGAAKNPNDSEQQESLRRAAEDLRSATNSAAGNALRRKVIRNLAIASKNAVTAATQTIAAAHNAGSTNRNTASQQQLVTQCQSVQATIPQLVQSFRATAANPDSPGAQLALINTSGALIQPSTKMVAAAISAVVTIGDQATALQLSAAAKQLAQSLSELRNTMSKAHETCGSLEIDSALDTIHSLQDELTETQKSAESGNLLPLPGETGETSALVLGSTSKTVGSSMAQLLTAAAQGNENYTGIAARDTANALKVLSGAVRGVAADTQDRVAQRHLIGAARDVLDKSEQLVSEAKIVSQNPSNPDNQQRLSQVAKLVSSALNNCLSCLPGQRDVDEAIRRITDTSRALSSPKFTQTAGRNFQHLQGDLNMAAADLNAAASDLVTASREAPDKLPKAAVNLSTGYTDLITVGMEMAGHTKETDRQTAVLSNLKTISMASSKLLLAAKSLSADPYAPNAKNQLSAAAKAVTESINDLINICTESAPGQKECDNALRKIQVISGMLDNPTEPVNDLAYYECFDSVTDKSKVLGEGMTSIIQHAKHSEHEQFGVSVSATSDAVCALTEAAAQSAYLVGISDAASTPGKPGLVDPSQFARANQAIQMACQTLLNPTSTQQQVLSAATVIAKHTSSLCNICRTASSKTNNPVAKRHFVQSAKDVANSTAGLVQCIKAVDGNFTPDTREACTIATRPLLEAVENLSTFASSPEFSSVPAKISPEARSAQQPIITSGKAMITSSYNMIETAKRLAVNPRDPPTWQLLAAHSKNVSESIKKLVAAIRDKAPGQRECDEAIDKINSAIKSIDHTSLSAISQTLQPIGEYPLQSFQEQMFNSTNQIRGVIDNVAMAAMSQPERLGAVVSNMADYFDPLTHAAVGAASRIKNSNKQISLLEQTKTLAECGLQLTYAAKEGGGNPKAVHTHSAIREAAECMKDAILDLTKTLEETATENGLVNGMVDNINNAMTLMDEPDSAGVVKQPGSFVDFQTEMVKLAKNIARKSQDMVPRAESGLVAPLAGEISRDYSALVSTSRSTINTLPSDEVGLGHRIRASVQDLGRSVVALVQKAAALQSDPHDQPTKTSLIDTSRIVAEKVSYVLAALQAGSRGTQACIHAVNTVSGIIGDLDTTIMFATSGTLTPDAGLGTFSDHRETILRTAKALVEDTKKLVSGAASNQEQLATAAQAAVATITGLSDVVKLGASTLGTDSNDAQILLMNAVKDVASALGDLIDATKKASGKPAEDPAMDQLKTSAKSMVTNITSLLKTVRTVEDRAARGSRALETTMEAIVQEMKVLSSHDAPHETSTPEQLLATTKDVTKATARAVAAGISGRQDDLMSAANLSRKAVCDLISVCKGAAWMSENPELKHKTLVSGHTVSARFLELLHHITIIIGNPTTENIQHLSALSKNVADSLGEVVQTAEILKGSDWVNPEDPSVVAENELLGAASQIEAAAKKLAALRPRQRKEADESLNFEEQILEAAKSITSAIGALMNAASTAQRELIRQGKISVASPGRQYHDDDQWSHGLISAAHLVAAATNSLCEAANSAVQGNASQEKLISSAKQVAASTAQLLVACRVKAGVDNVVMRRLQVAGNAVKKATDILVEAAQQAANFTDDSETVSVKASNVAGMAQEIMAAEEILRKEKELEMARMKLEHIRKARYKNRPPSDEDD